MGLENRRSGNASEGSNTSLSASFPADQPVSAMRISRCSAPVLTYADGTRVGTDQTFIYFIASHGGPIKIGHAFDPKHRLAAIQTGNPEPLLILAVVRGPRSLERRYHQQFAHLRLSGEWFRRSGEIEHEILRIDPGAMSRIDEWADLAGDKYGCQVCDPFPCRLHIHREAPLWGASHA